MQPVRSAGCTGTGRSASMLGLREHPAITLAEAQTIARADLNGGALALRSLQENFILISFGCVSIGESAFPRAPFSYYASSLSSTEAADICKKHKDSTNRRLSSHALSDTCRRKKSCAFPNATEFSSVPATAVIWPRPH